MVTHSKQRGAIKIKRGTVLNDNCRLDSGISTIKLGKFSAIANNVAFWGIDHDLKLPALQVRFYEKILDLSYKFQSKGEINVGNDVLIGQSAIILPGVTIGNGSVVGAGTVVTSDVDPYTIVAGVPGKCIRSRFEKETITFLENLQWWDWSWERLTQNKKFFQTDISKIRDINDIRQLII